jgi:hypothetical protein
MTRPSDCDKLLALTGHEVEIFIFALDCLIGNYRLSIQSVDESNKGVLDIELLEAQSLKRRLEEL